MFGHSPFSFLTFAESPVNAQVTLTGVEARGSEDLGGARHAEYFVPDDAGNPNITVVAYEDSTTVSADGSSLGTISSAGGTLTVSASNYENKIISANKPITLQNANNETVGVPTSWAGTSFGIRNTRTGVRLQMRALYGTASVEIFKDGVSTTTLSVGSTATTTQTYSDDTSDPEYTIFSDIPIMVFKSGDSNLTTDCRSLFPATTDFIYGIASGSASAVRVDGYGETGVLIERFASNGTSATGSSFPLSTTGNYFAGGTDFTGPSNRFKSPKAAIAFSIADSDGGEKTSFVPEGCFANEFRLIEAAEFVCFMGAPGTNGRNIKVFNSSGTLVDTIQLATSNTGSDFPTKFQLISSTTTDSNLTGNAKSYALTAGMRFVSEVPVGAIVEDDDANNENNLLGLRYFGGSVSGAASITLTGVAGTGQVGDLADASDVKVEHEVTASISGAATVSGTATLRAAGQASVSGTATVADVAVTSFQLVTASASGTGTVSASAALIATSSASVSGAGTGASTATARLIASSSISASGASSATATGLRPGDSTISGTATASGTALLRAKGAASVSGDATASSSGVRVRTGAASVSGDATVSAAATLLAPVTSSVSGQATASSSAVLRAVAASSVSGAATVSAAAIRVREGASSVSGAGTVAGSAVRVKDESASVSGAASVSASSIRVRNTSSSVAGAATVSAAAIRVRDGASSVSGDASQSSAAVRVRNESASVSGAATATATGIRVQVVTSSVIGTASIAGLATRRRIGAGSVSGTAIVVATGFRSFRFDATFYERDRVAFVAQEPARTVAVGKPTEHTLYVVQDAQRVVLVPEDKPRTVFVSQPVQRLAKVA